MTVEEQRELQRQVKAHQASLHPAELRRRGRLVREANGLIGRLTKRVVTVAKVDAEQYRRSSEALKRACNRATRREKEYYGA